MSHILSQEVRAQYEALTSGAGFCDLSGRTQVEIAGRDRASFLHGLCTNHIKRLAPGSGCEAFLTDVQGKTVGYVYVFCQPDALVLNTAPGQAETIIRALDRYIVREDVLLEDRSDQWREVLVGGAESKQLLGRLLNTEVPEQPLASVAAKLYGQPLWLRRVPFTGRACFFLSFAREVASLFAGALKSAGAVECGRTAVEIARIEAGTPEFGRDISSDNLPQEVDRNELAISFTKGCYLGQETVARIDAMGHVNRTLAGLRFAGSEIPPAGAEISSGGKVVAKVTSACWSFKLAAPLALAYVRRGHHHPGARLQSDYGEAEVMTLPIFHPNL